MPKEVTDPELLKQLNAPGGTKPVTDPELLKQLNAPEEPESRAWQFTRGAGRGIAGLLQSAGEILPDPMDLIHGGLPEDAKKAREQAKGELRKFTDAPDKSGWETGGRLTGQIAPFALFPGVGAESALGSIAERAAIGGIAGGLQPTAEHTAASHIPGAAGGAVVGGAGRAILGRGSNLLNLIQSGGAGQTATRAAIGLALEPTVASSLEGLGLPKKYAHTIASAIAVAMVGGGGSIPMLPMDVPGSIAARLGSAAAGAITEKFSERKKPRSSERQ
jgi:hypothetical protein